MAAASGNKYNVQGISFRSAEFLEKGKARAAGLRMSFSQYVNYLIEQDLEQRAPIVLSENSEPHGNTGVAKRMKAENEPTKAPSSTVEAAAASLLSEGVRRIKKEREKK